MSEAGKVLRRTIPWAGLVVGLGSFIVVHQFGSEGSFDDCRAVAPIPVLIVAIIGLILCGIAGLVSWRGTRQSGASDRVVGAISLGCSIFFAFAILLAIVADLLLPPCFA